MFEPEWWQVEVPPRRRVFGFIVAHKAVHLGKEAIEDSGFGYGRFHEMVHEGLVFLGKWANGKAGGTR